MNKGHAISRLIELFTIWWSEGESALRRYHDEPSLDMGLTYSESNAVPKVASMNIEASSRMDEENVRQDKRPREDEFTRFVGFFNKIQLSRSRLHSSIMWVLRVKDLFFASYLHLYTLVMLMYHLCLRDLSSMISWYYSKFHQAALTESGLELWRDIVGSRPPSTESSSGFFSVNLIHQKMTERVHAHMFMHCIIFTRLVNEHQFICLINKAIFLSEQSSGTSKI